MSQPRKVVSWAPLPAEGVSLPEELTTGDELWIFEAPADLDLSALDGKKIHFRDGQIIDGQGKGMFSKQLVIEDYQHLQSKSERIVMPDRENNKWRFVNPTGRISIIDQLDQLEYLEQIPGTSAASCPKLPTGLKKRYRPYGAQIRSAKKSATKSENIEFQSKKKKKRRTSK